MTQRASCRGRLLQRPDIRLVHRRVGPDTVLGVIDLLQPMSDRGRAWLEAHANGREWRDGALAIEPAIYTPGSLLAQARAAGLGLTGCGPVSGGMLKDLRTYSAPELTLEQIADRLGFTPEEWRLMEEDERIVPDPDELWDRAMELCNKLWEESDRRASAAEFN